MSITCSVVGTPSGKRARCHFRIDVRRRYLKCVLRRPAGTPACGPLRWISGCERSGRRRSDHTLPPKPPENSSDRCARCCRRVFRGPAASRAGTRHCSGYEGYQPATLQRHSGIRCRYVPSKDSVDRPCQPARQMAMSALKVGGTITVVVGQALAVSIEPAPESWL
jgi:hypothetical protein